MQARISRKVEGERGISASPQEGTPLLRPGRRLRGQVIRFGLVGVVNTAVDIGLLNLLSWIFQSYQGGGIFGLNTLSYAVATINSYLLNKYWTLGDREKHHEALKFSQFVTINCLGALANSSIVSGLTSCFQAPALLMEWSGISLHSSTFHPCRSACFG